MYWYLLDHIGGGRLGMNARQHEPNDPSIQLEV